MPSRLALTATAPRMRQNEQLQRRAVRRPSVSSTVNFTVPQWQAARSGVRASASFSSSVMCLASDMCKEAPS